MASQEAEEEAGGRRWRRPEDKKQGDGSIVPFLGQKGHSKSPKAWNKRDRPRNAYLLISVYEKIKMTI